MGTWGPGVDEDDVFVDVYQEFMDAYDEGGEPNTLRESIREEMALYFDDRDGASSALFALAQACWDTKSLTDALLEEVRVRIESCADQRSMSSRDATEEFMLERQAHLVKFIEKLSTPRKSKKRRNRNKDKITSDTILELPSPSGRKKLEVSKLVINGKYENTGASLSWGVGGGGLFGFQDDEITVQASWIDEGNLKIAIGGECFIQELRDYMYFMGDEVHIRYDAPGVTTWNMKYPPANEK